MDDDETHGIFARRQFEHGDSLSQRTFRERQTTQLRRFGAVAGAGANVEEIEELTPDGESLLDDGDGGNELLAVGVVT